MIISALDQNGDWSFGNGKSSYKKGLEALKQNVKTRLLEWKGDCFFNANAGVDWYNRLAKRNQIKSLLNEIKTVILNTDGVLQALEINHELRSDRSLTVNFSIKTVFGQIDDNILV